MVWLWKRWCRVLVSLLLVAGVGAFGALEMGCTVDQCHRYFQEVKRRCQLGSSAEGAKLDRYLERNFTACQLDICNRASINNIDCFNPDTHVPGGLSGRFFTCKD